MATPKILIVDDETTICLVLQGILESKGAEICTGHSGEDAIRLVKEEKPDVVVMDIIMPGMNGIQALAEIKKISPKTQVIMMTSDAAVDSAVEANREGAFDYLQKPFDHIDDVWSVVERALAQANSPTEVAAGSEAAMETDPGAPPEILVLDDEDSIRHVLTSLLEMKECTVRQAGSAEEGVNILKDWEPAVALVDIVLPGKSGISFLGEVKRAYPDTEVLIMTSKASAETAVKAIRLGAYDYVKKPFVLEEVWDVVSRALERRRLNLRNRALLDQQEEKRRELSESVSLIEETPTEVDSEILDEFLTLVCSELRVERATLMLRRDDSDDLAITVCHGFDSVNARIPAGHGIAGRVLRSGEPYCASGTDATDDTVDPEDPASFLGEVPIAMSVAVKTEHEVLGVINVDRGERNGTFDTEELSYLVRMGAQLAATIDGARRADQLQKAYESLKAAQQQLVFSERIKAVGQMAAGVAHDFNNVLSVILARAQFIERTLRCDFDPLKTQEHIAAIIKTALQGAEAIKRVQDYTRIRKDVVRSPVDINETIRDAVEIARPKWRAQAKKDGTVIDVEMNLEAVPRVSGNRYELAQVFGNLIFNAVEAMPAGGTLSFRSYTDTDEVVVEVRDTGTGIDKEGLEHLFEPFYTTKDNGQGLGTSILYGIVTRHGGDIRVESTVGVGTSFRVSLPAADPADQADEIDSAVEQVLGGEVTARVLLVDDDEMVLETYEEALSLTGHEVFACGSGELALQALRDGPFDVVVTDMSMQGMTGLELSAKIKTDHPEIRVVLSSGWAVSESSEEVVESGVDHVLVKPVLLDDLLGTIQKAARRPVKV